jgi:hypothetical protein
MQPDYLNELMFYKEHLTEKAREQVQRFTSQEQTG